MIRSTTDNPTDPLGGLGPAVKPAAKPAPEWRPVTPGIERNAAGQVRTTAPAPAPIVWIPTPRD
jgi:hypothetical protein